MWKSILVFSVAAVIAASSAWSYEAVEVKNGGSLRGKVKVDRGDPAG